LDAIRNEAGTTGKVVTGAGRVHANAQIPGAEDYYNLPVLKPPTWTWEVPRYFFFGGIAGVSSVIAFVGHPFHADPRMVRVALWIAFVGTGLCPARHRDSGLARKPPDTSGPLSHVRSRRFVSNSGALRVPCARDADPGIRGGQYRDGDRSHPRIAPRPAPAERDKRETRHLPA
jgi:hypothetical protein